MLNNFPIMAATGFHVAGHVDALYIFLLIVTGMMALLVFVCIIFFAARYRHRPGVRAEQIEGSNALEITWSAIPFLIFMVIFVWGALVYFKERTPPTDASEVYVVASNGCGKWNTPKGSVKSTNCTFPWGVDVKLIMTSQDVIHSFYIPAFRIKQDVLPGRLQRGMVSRHQARCLSSILRGVIVARKLPAWSDRSWFRNQRSMRRG